MTSFKSCLLAVVGALPVVALAQTAPQAPTGIVLGGGLFLKPVLDLSYLHDSNLYRQETDETSASAYVIAPGVGLEYLSADDTYRIGYQGEFANYDTDGFDDYGESDLLFEASLNQTGRHRLAFNLARDEGHDPFGTERTETQPLSQRDVDEFVRTSGRAAYTFGAPSAMLNMTVFADGLSKDYQNNRDLTQYLDRSIFGGGVEGKWRISPRTGLLADVRVRKIEFDTVRPTFSARDGTEQRIRVGGQWFASSTVSGRVLVGAMRREFDANDREDFSSFDWEAVISWHPMTYTEIVLDGGHSTQESYFEESDFIDVNRIGLRWVQSWNERFKTGLSGDLMSFEFEGFDRSDDIVSGQVYGELELTRNLKAHLSFQINNRDTNVPSLDFDRSLTQLRLQFAL